MGPGLDFTSGYGATIYGDGENLMRAQRWPRRTGRSITDFQRERINSDRIESITSGGIAKILNPGTKHIG